MANKIEFEVLGDVKDLDKKLEKTKRAFNNLGKVGAIAFAGISASVFKFIDAAHEQEQATNQLNQALKNQGHFTEAASKDLQKFADTMADVSLFTDDAIVQSEAIIASFGFEGQALKDLTKATLDLAQAKGMDLASAADLVAKSVGSDVNALARYGIAVDGVAGSTERAAGAISGINRLYEGQAKAATEGLGATIQLKKAFGELAEQIGFALAPTVETITKRLKEFVDTAKNHPEVAKFSADVLILGLQLSALAVAISAIAKITFAWQAAMKFLEAQTALTAKSLLSVGTALRVISAVGVAAFVGWNVGKLVSEITGLDVAVQKLGTHLGNLKAQKSLGTDFISESDFNAKKEAEGWAARAKARQDDIDDQVNFINKKKTIQEQELERQQQFQEQLNSLSTFDLEKMLADIETQVSLTQDFEKQKTAILEEEIARRKELEDQSITGFVNGFQEGLARIKTDLISLREVGKDLAFTLQSSLSDSFSDIILRVKTAKEAFAEFGKTILKAVVDYVSQWLAFQVISKTAMIAAKIAGVATAGTLAAAWGPVAAFVSLATFGANAPPAAAAISGTVALAALLGLPKFAQGSAGIKDDTMGLFNKGEVVIPNSFSDAIKRGDLTLSGPQGGGSNGIVFDFRGAQFNGINDKFVEDIFTRASENLASRTLAFRGA